MITLEQVETVEGMQVYGDDTQPNVFYIIPNQPRFRTDEAGRPVFNFIKYAGQPGTSPSQPSKPATGSETQPAPREHEKGGGYCMFDVEFSPTKAQEDAVRATLESTHKARLGNRPIMFATPTYLSGTAEMLIEQDGTLVQHVFNKGKPSLVGRNVACFSTQLTERGAQVFESALRDGNGMVQINYSLTAPARLGGARVTVSYEAEQVSSFMEQIGTRGTNGLSKKIEQAYEQNRAGTIKVDVTSTKINAEAVNKLREWATQLLQAEMAKQLNLTASVDAAERERFEKMAMDDARTNGVAYRGWLWFYYATLPLPRQHELKSAARAKCSFTAEYTEKAAHDWTFSPQGMLPAITRLKDGKGEQLQWSDFCKAITLDDPFFRTVRTTISVNARWKALDIDSVIVNAYYPPATKDAKFASWTMRDSDHPVVFSALRRDTDEVEYTYKVNYVGRERIYESPRLRAEGNITVNIGALGVLYVEIIDSALVFDEILTAATVEIEYADAAKGIKIERKVTLPVKAAAAVDDDPFGGAGGEEGKKEGAPARPQQLAVVEPLFAAVTKPYRYRVTYHLKNTLLEMPWKESTDSRIYVSSPFSMTQEVTFLATVDNDIEWVRVTPKYWDKANGYVMVGAPIEFTQSKDMSDWSARVIRPGSGEFYYQAVIRYKAEAKKPKRVVKLAECGGFPAGQLVTVELTAP